MKQNKSERIPRCIHLKALLLGLLLGSAILPVAGQVLGVWPYRQEITISGALSKSDLADFPLLISLTDPDNPLFQRAQANGADIVFTAADGHTRLDHEIEFFDASPATAALHAWVRLPLLPGGTATNIMMHYGRRDVGDQANPTGVWDEHFAAVWHLDEEAAGVGNSGVYRDSTGNGQHGIDYVSASDKAGKIGRGQYFDSSESDYILTGTAGYLDWNSDFTISAWIRQSSELDSKTIVGTAGGYYPMLLSVRAGTGGIGSIHGLVGYQRLDSSYATLLPYYNASITTWSYFTVKREADVLTFYQNGVQRGTPLAVENSVDYGDMRLIIGGNNSTLGRWEGWIDEVRASQTARSQAWIEASYRIMHANAAYVIFAPELPMKIDGRWAFRQPVTISGSLTTELLADFPVLVTISDPANPLFAAARSDGSDIIFTMADDLTRPLDHEIELFSTTPGAESLVAWVRLPQLLPGDDTAIYLYYGNPASRNLANPAGVWQNDYLAVWHLGEDAPGSGTSGLYRDSTGNERHGDDYVDAVGKEGIVGRGQRFTAALSDRIQTPSPGYLQWDADFTISAWMRINTNKHWGAAVATAFSDYPQLITYHSSNRGLIGYKKTSGHGLCYYYLRPAPTDWTHITVRRANDVLTVYHNGAQLGLIISEVSGYDEFPIVDSYAYAPLSLTIGSYGGTGFGGHRWEGWVDEVRASQTARSPAWIAANYRIMGENSDYVTVGRQQCRIHGTLLLIQ